MFRNLVTFETDTLILKYMLMSIKTIQVIGLNLLEICYQGERQDYMVYKIKDYTEPLLKILEKHQMQVNPDDDHISLADSISELIYTILEKQPRFEKEFMK